LIINTPVARNKITIMALEHTVEPKSSQLSKTHVFRRPMASKKKEEVLSSLN
jgi:hypothetical protein